MRRSCDSFTGSEAGCAQGPSPMMTRERAANARSGLRMLFLKGVIITYREGAGRSLYRPDGYDPSAPANVRQELLRLSNQHKAGPEEGVRGPLGLAALANHVHLGGMQRIKFALFLP